MGEESATGRRGGQRQHIADPDRQRRLAAALQAAHDAGAAVAPDGQIGGLAGLGAQCLHRFLGQGDDVVLVDGGEPELHGGGAERSEEHTSELQSLMRISYAVFCLKKKKTYNNNKITNIS